MTDTRDEKYTREDRDLLITINTKLGAVIETVNDLKNNTLTRIEALERQKANESEIEKIYFTRSPKWDSFTQRIETLEKAKVDHTDYCSLNQRVDNLENWRWWIIGVFSVISVVVALVVFIYLRDIGELKENLEKHTEQSDVILKNINK